MKNLDRSPASRHTTVKLLQDGPRRRESLVGLARLEDHMLSLPELVEAEASANLASVKERELTD